MLPRPPSPLVPDFTSGAMRLRSSGERSCPPTTSGRSWMNLLLIAVVTFTLSVCICRTSEVTVTASSKPPTRKLRVHANGAAGSDLDILERRRLKILDGDDHDVAADRQLGDGVGALVRGRDLPLEVGGDVHGFDGGARDDRGRIDRSPAR